MASEYSPVMIGASSGSIVLTPNETSVTAVTLPLNGTGAGVLVAPSGTPTNTNVGATSTFTITLMNNGNIPWTPGAPALTGDYTAGAVSPATIPAGQSGTLTVTFAPMQSGTRNGSLSFATPDVTPLSTTLPYTFSAEGLSGAGVSLVSAKDGFAIGSVYPNPASSSASVLVTMPRSAKATLSIVRVDGSQVASVFEGTLSEGQHVMNVDVKDLASGTYFYTLESGNVRLVRQMVVAK